MYQLIASKKYSITVLQMFLLVTLGGLDELEKTTSTGMVTSIVPTKVVLAHLMAAVTRVWITMALWLKTCVTVMLETKSMWMLECLHRKINCLLWCWHMEIHEKEQVGFSIGNWFSISSLFPESTSSTSILLKVGLFTNTILKIGEFFLLRQTRLLSKWSRNHETIGWTWNEVCLIFFPYMYTNQQNLVSFRDDELQDQIDAIGSDWLQFETVIWLYLKKLRNPALKIDRCRFDRRN